MVYTTAVAALVLWLLGLVTGYTMGGAIHLILIAAVIAIITKFILGGRPTP